MQRPVRPEDQDRVHRVQLRRHQEAVHPGTVQPCNNPRQRGHGRHL